MLFDVWCWWYKTPSIKSVAKFYTYIHTNIGQIIDESIFDLSKKTIIDQLETKWSIDRLREREKGREENDLTRSVFFLSDKSYDLWLWPDKRKKKKKKKKQSAYEGG